MTNEAQGKIDFITFLMSMATSAMINLGEVEHPETGKKEKDLELSNQSIELLSMLQEKTKGNLTEKEDKFLNSILYDLRMKYVACTSGNVTPGRA